LNPDSESSSRHQGGSYDGHPCTCTRKCPAACDGTCGCEACTRAWLDNNLDDLIGVTWQRAGEAS
jgi:hypothetical protein